MKSVRIAWVGLGAVLVLTTPAGAWGPTTHQLVVSKAIDTLPKDLKNFYKRHRLEIPSLAIEPQIPEEGPERRFRVDRLLPFPFQELPWTEPELHQRFPEAAEIGRLPWLIHESYAKLVEAFRAQDKPRILAESDRLAGFVADIHNPLALTRNADGQETGQHGLWVRFSLTFPDTMSRRLKLDPDAAHFLDNPNTYVFSMASGAYIWLDNLLYHEELARRGKAGYTEIYYEALEFRAGEILRHRLSEATGDVGSYWYTAWTEAGRPEIE